MAGVWSHQSGAPSQDAEADAPLRPRLSDLKPGMGVTWVSPVFGEVIGIVDMPPAKGWIVIAEHSVTSKTCSIPIDWIVSVAE